MYSGAHVPGRSLEGLCPVTIPFQEMLPDFKFSTAKRSLICRHINQGNWAECKQGTQPVLGFPFQFVNVLWDRLS